MVKYKCIKTQCPICGNLGSCQLFLNREGTIRYSRVRHYEGKGKFTYHKVEDLEALKTLLKSQDISISNSKAMGQLGQEQTLEKHDPNLKDLSSVSSGRSLVWLGHQPPTLTTRVQIPATAPITGKF
jgi:hypothetical protein